MHPDFKKIEQAKIRFPYARQPRCLEPTMDFLALVWVNTRRSCSWAIPLKSYRRAGGFAGRGLCGIHRFAADSQQSSYDTVVLAAVPVAA